MTNVEKVLLKHGKITQADVDKKEKTKSDKVKAVDAVKADKGKDKAKLTKTELIAKIAELEAIIESL